MRSVLKGLTAYLERKIFNITGTEYATHCDEPATSLPSADPQVLKAGSQNICTLTFLLSPFTRASE